MTDNDTQLTEGPQPIPVPPPPLYNYATERLLAAANASLAAWDDEEYSVREEHKETIEELRDAIFYFDRHGHKPRR